MTTTLSSSEYRNAISRFLTGVTIITTRHDQRDHGITASAVASVSLEPPTLLVCLNRLSATCQAISESATFCVHVLAADQLELARHFAGKHTDKFAQLPTAKRPGYHHGPTGNPQLDDVLALLECRVSNQVDVGTHRIFFGEVITAAANDGAPLSYFRGQFNDIGR